MIFAKRGKIPAPLMSNRVLLRAHLGLVLICVPAFAQTFPKKDAAGHDFSKEGAVIERMTTKVVFQSDGTYMYEQHVRVRVQSDSGVRQYGVLPFPYPQRDDKSRLAICGKIQQNVVLPLLAAVARLVPFTWKR